MFQPKAAGGIGLTTINAVIVLEPFREPFRTRPTGLGAARGATGEEHSHPEQHHVGGVKAREVIDGTVVVEHAGEIDVLLVIGDEGVRAQLADALPPPTPLDSLDPLTTFGRVTGLGPGEQVGSSTDIAQLRTVGTLCTAADGGGGRHPVRSISRTTARSRGTSSVRRSGPSKL